MWFRLTMNSVSPRLASNSSRSFCISLLSARVTRATMLGGVNRSPVLVLSQQCTTSLVFLQCQGLYMLRSTSMPKEVDLLQKYALYIPLPGVSNTPFTFLIFSCISISTNKRELFLSVVSLPNQETLPGTRKQFLMYIQSSTFLEALRKKKKNFLPESLKKETVLSKQYLASIQRLQQR